MQRYNPKTIESKWQKIWAETGLYKTPTNPGENKYYCLVMFPYPSGNLHVGHWYNFGPADVIARFNRMQGKDILHPIGFDAFGLPAENAAIKRGIPPATWTDSNIGTMTTQLKAIGTMYDMDKVINTSKPEYYRWTQWMFLKLYENGLAYKKKGVVNWCTVDQTVLANEQVVGDNNECERCGGLVIQKELEQWYFKITDYADRLLEDSANLDWPERVLTMQENWIGRSVGAEVSFEIDGHQENLKVFTTRPDTIFGVTFMVLAPEHHLVKKLTTDKQKQQVEEYVAKVAKKTELDRKQDEKKKSGVFTGAYAINPATKAKIPIWIGDFVLMGYGEGAIMAVPGHDQRDHDFAVKYDLPIEYVVEPTFGEAQGNDHLKPSVYVALRDKAANKVVVLNWGPRKDRHGGNMLIGGSIEENEDLIETAKREITEETGYVNFEFVSQTPFEGHGYFYSDVKGKNMLASGRGLLFDLVDHTKTKTNLDEGEKNKFEVEWHPVEVIAGMLHDGIHQAVYEHLLLDQVYSGEGVMINSGKYNGMSSSEAREKIVADLSGKIGDKTVEVTYANNGEPIFTQITDSSAVKEGAPFVERDAITAIVKHWKEDKYIGLKWKKVDWETVVTGGIEAGQTAEEAAIAEIREETGYLNPVLKRDLGNMQARFFHVPKDENRHANFKCLYFELADGEKEEIVEEEKQNHSVVWLSREEMDKFRLPSSQRYAWDVLNGRSSARERSTYRLRDWLISRQRYWGAPIPIIYCDDCGTVPVPYDQLPVNLPEDVAFEPTGQSPLLKDDEFVHTTCPKCSKPARRETDTMDTFVDSSWYFLRYPNTNYTDGPFDPEAVKQWMPVDHYIGGIEHAILHLLYARFITKALHDHADLPFDEPFKKLSNQGIILGPDGQKMSKSKGNVVDPDEQVASYGADSLRLYLMFMGPYDQGGPYDFGGIAGVRRFLERIWDITEGYLSDNRDELQTNKDEAATKLAIVTQRTVKKVTGDLQKLAFNTTIAALMELVNEMNKLRKEVSFAANKDEWRYAIETLLKLLSPLAPHMTEELWSEMGHKDSIHTEAWPTWDENLIKEDLVTIVVQVNGKVRATLLADPETSEQETVEAAKNDENIKSHLGKGEIKKVIYVKGKLVNFVI